MLYFISFVFDVNVCYLVNMHLPGMHFPIPLFSTVLNHDVLGFKEKYINFDLTVSIPT